MVVSPFSDWISVSIFRAEKITISLNICHCWIYMKLRINIFPMFGDASKNYDERHLCITILVKRVTATKLFEPKIRNAHKFWKKCWIWKNFCVLLRHDEACSFDVWPSISLQAKIERIWSVCDDFSLILLRCAITKKRKNKKKKSNLCSITNHANWAKSFWFIQLTEIG